MSSVVVQPLAPPTAQKTRSPLETVITILGILFCLYMFVVGVSGMGEAFKMFGADFANRILGATRNPFAALMMGLLATSIVQSSSTTTSIIVGMVAGGALDPAAAVPMVMGANIGTTLTAMMVALGSIKHPAEFERAFAASLLHLLFNILAVAIIFPLEVTTHALTHSAELGQTMFDGAGGMKMANPLKTATGPVIHLIQQVLFHKPVLVLIVTIGITYVTLAGIVSLLRRLVLAKVEAFFDKVLFRDWRRAMLFGFLLTLALQTSSVTTSLVTPLAGAGVLKLTQIFPFVLGSNLGTPISAFLAALATGERLPVVVAFTHIAFNILGILLLWPIPAVRRIPLVAAQKLAHRCAQNRYLPFALIISVYFVIPIILIVIIP